MENMKVKNVVISKQIEASGNFRKFIEIAKNKKINLIVVKKGDRLKIEKNLSFDILWPDNKNLIAENGLNNNSIVCKLKYKEFSCLFTGDIEKLAEEKILKENLDLKADVLKVAHHGSKTSTIQNFIEAVNPKAALIGVGKNNTFGHPSSDVINRLEKLRY